MTIYSLDVLLFLCGTVCWSMSSSNCCFLTCIQVSQEADQVVWYSHLFQSFPQFIVIHTVKGLGMVNNVTSWLIGKDSDAGRDWGQEEKGTTEDEMAGWHHWLDGRKSERTPGVGDGQGGLACCDSWGRKESDTTQRLIWSDLIWYCDKVGLIPLIQGWLYIRNFIHILHHGNIFKDKDPDVGEDWSQKE